MAKTKAEKAAYMRTWNAAHREKCNAQSRAYHLAHRDEEHIRDRAYREAHQEKERASDRVYYAIHREEIVVRRRACYETHREERLVIIRAYGKSHPQIYAEKNRRRNALKRGATVGPIDLAAIKIRDRMRCCICGRKVNEKLKHPHPDSLSFDHSHPLGLLGPHSQENLRVAHLRCNIRRGPGRLSVQMVLL